MPVKLDELMKAAGEPTRLRILNLLGQGSVCVCDMQSVLGIPQPTISRHLAVLRHAGLVKDDRQGTRMVSWARCAAFWRSIQGAKRLCERTWIS